MAKKQQEENKAMEFILTYGWAILAAIIAIGVLAYFSLQPQDNEEFDLTEFKEKVERYEYCNDGCINMVRIIFGTVKSLEGDLAFDICRDECSNQIFGEEVE